MLVKATTPNSIKMEALNLAVCTQTKGHFYRFDMRHISGISVYGGHMMSLAVDQPYAPFILMSSPPQDLSSAPSPLSTWMLIALSRLVRPFAFSMELSTIWTF